MERLLVERKGREEYVDVVDQRHRENDSRRMAIGDEIFVNTIGDENGLQMASYFYAC